MNNLLIWASSVGLLCVTLYWSIKRRSPWPLLGTLFSLALVLGLLLWAKAIEPPSDIYSGLSQGGLTGEEPHSRGESRAPLTVALYIGMLTGMFSHYLFFHFFRPRNRRTKFDIGNLLAPVFVSPIVFLPLESAFESMVQNSSATNNISIMLLLVAFENGFFWKEFFDNRAQAWSTGD